MEHNQISFLDKIFGKQYNNTVENCIETIYQQALASLDDRGAEEFKNLVCNAIDSWKAMDWQVTAPACRSVPVMEIKKEDFYYQKAMFDTLQSIYVPNRLKGLPFLVAKTLVKLGFKIYITVSEKTTTLWCTVKDRELENASIPFGQTNENQK